MKLSSETTDIFTNRVGNSFRTKQTVCGQIASFGNKLIGNNVSLYKGAGGQTASVRYMSNGNTTGTDITPEPNDDVEHVATGTDSTPEPNGDVEYVAPVTDDTPAPNDDVEYVATGEEITSQ
ncbi:Hypothetical predicted protein [Mytilus galloprovincialis]|uniref:Uncharacterized protein n=1 Tax=Mytilus galloprovincialis TaxID=29158 RepID=A0A8B6GNZ6_MYTGA|nr:Hypothetical predicted protein [Mytilus galloprovincialis]